jgi:MEMO1 family protein
MPVGEEELPDLEFEISALTPPHPVSSYTEIIPGKHGIVLSRDGHSAVFLPQVATEQGWDLETTLSRLARKAGLPGDAWKKGAQFLIFEAVVFSEDDV